jgi:hypothetical protein
MWSFREGMLLLIETLRDRLQRPPLLGVNVRRIENAGPGWLVRGEGRDHWQADAVVLACPAYRQAAILADLDLELSERIGSIAWSRVAVVGLGYRQEDVPVAVDGFGYIAPQRTRRDLLGVQWCSSIFPDRAPPGMVLLRSLCGGWHRPEVVGWFAHRDQFAFAPAFEYAEDARRFEGGTPSAAAVYAASAGLQMVLEIGIERLRVRQLELTADLVGRAREAGLHPRVPVDLREHAGIATIPRQDPPAVVRGLRDARVIVDARPGIVRVSPFFFNVPEDHERAVEAFLALERRGIR